MLSIRITGSIRDESGEALIGANAYLKGTFDGATSEEGGIFSFSTEEHTGTLLVSFLGFNTYEQSLSLSEDSIYVNIVLIAANNTLDQVVITAGAFEAGDEKKGVVLNSIDIATTAGANADIAAAMNMLPGTQVVGETGQLFVRGGAAHETRVFIDGLRVTTPYSSQVPDVPARGRFSPFLFKGTLFSTGGYSAEYGQALSSALLLNTQDLPEKSITGISLMTVGAQLSRTHRWDNASLSVDGTYTNLSPYMSLVPQNMNWEVAPQTYGGALSYKLKTSETGMLKTFLTTDRNKMKVDIPGIEGSPSQGFYGMDNDNVFFNSTYQELMGNGILFRGGISMTRNLEALEIINGQIDEIDQSFQFKGTFSKDINHNLRLRWGANFIRHHYEQQLQGFDSLVQPINLIAKDDLGVLFSESEWNIGKKWALRGGIRAEYSSILNKANFAPRFSMAYKLDRYSQFSFASGLFYQNPEAQYLSIQPSLRFERADHLIFNYQWEKERKIFRAEAYYKKYHHLSRFDGLSPYDPEGFNSQGEGYARGLDIFWRDRKSIKNADYWISYSWLDTERLYNEFTERATPAFASAHNLSVVGKYWFPKLESQLGITYRFASPRPYHNPKLAGFNQSRTPAYHDLSANISYLTTLWGNFTIVFVSLTNILGAEQIFGYRYDMLPGSTEIGPARAVRPPAKRFFFTGIFLSID